MLNITPDEQKCGVKGRQLTDIIRNLDSIAEDTDQGYFLLLDQEKAFDRVSQKYLFMILEKLGFKGNFLSMVKSMYDNITSTIVINGQKSRAIDVERSIRQGCPLSMLVCYFFHSTDKHVKEVRKIAGF